MPTLVHQPYLFCKLADNQSILHCTSISLHYVPPTCILHSRNRLLWPQDESRIVQLCHVLDLSNSYNRVALGGSIMYYDHILIQILSFITYSLYTLDHHQTSIRCVGKFFHNLPPLHIHNCMNKLLWPQLESH